MDSRFKEIGYEREFTGEWDYEKAMAALRETLTGAEIERLAAEGAAWPEDRAVEAALSL